jgi:hypothetical protein
LDIVFQVANGIGDPLGEESQFIKLFSSCLDGDLFVACLATSGSMFFHRVNGHLPEAVLRATVLHNSSKTTCLEVLSQSDTLVMYVDLLIIVVAAVVTFLSELWDAAMAASKL